MVKLSDEELRQKLSFAKLALDSKIAELKQSDANFSQNERELLRKDKQFRRLYDDFWLAKLMNDKRKQPSIPVCTGQQYRHFLAMNSAMEDAVAKYEAAVSEWKWLHSKVRGFAFSKPSFGQKILAVRTVGVSCEMATTTIVDSATQTEENIALGGQISVPRVEHVGQSNDGSPDTADQTHKPCRKRARPAELSTTSEILWVGDENLEFPFSVLPPQEYFAKQQDAYVQALLAQLKAKGRIWRTMHWQRRAEELWQRLGPIIRIHCKNTLPVKLDRVVNYAPYSSREHWLLQQLVRVICDRIRKAMKVRKSTPVTYTLLDDGLHEAPTNRFGFVRFNDSSEDSDDSDGQKEVKAIRETLYKAKVKLDVPPSLFDLFQLEILNGGFGSERKSNKGTTVAVTSSEAFQSLGKMLQLQPSLTLLSTDNTTEQLQVEISVDTPCIFEHLGNLWHTSVSFHFRRTVKNAQVLRM